MSGESVDRCPECNGSPRADGDERVCTDCGLVLSVDRIDPGPEWRSFDDGTDRRRTGAPLTRSRHDRGLSTEIGYGNATRLTGRKRRRVNRMRREHDRARIATKRERNQVTGFREIRGIVADLSLPDSVTEAACALFETAQREDLLRGRSIEGFAAAAVYAVCRVRSISRTRSEVAVVARADERELTVAYAALNEALDVPTGPSDPGEYLARFASKLGLDAAVERRAREFVDRAIDTGHATGRKPGGVAAGCLYAAARELGVACTQDEAAEVAGVAPVTIRKTYHHLLDDDGRR